MVETRRTESRNPMEYQWDSGYQPDGDLGAGGPQMLWYFESTSREGERTGPELSYIHRYSPDLSPGEMRS